MAYGNQSGFSGRRINAKYTSKEGVTFLEVPYFLLSEKQGTEYPPLTKAQLVELTGQDTHPTEISGDLIELSTRVGSYEDQPVRSFKALLQDGDTRNYVEFGLGSIAGRSVANSLLNLKAFDAVSFGSYSQFNKAKGKSFAAVSVRQGKGATETVKWKYDPKVAGTPLPAVREFAGKGGKTERDYTEQEEFFLAQLNEFAKVIEASAKNRPAPKAVATPAPKADAPAAQENLDEDVPF